MSPSGDEGVWEDSDLAQQLLQALQIQEVWFAHRARVIAVAAWRVRFPEGWVDAPTWWVRGSQISPRGARQPKQKLGFSRRVPGARNRRRRVPLAWNPASTADFAVAASVADVD